MIQEFLLPDLGEGLAEAELVQWLVAEGDTVALNQTIAEVETAKAIVELPSPHTGVVRTLHAQPGATVDVGSPLISFEIEGADAATPVGSENAAEAGETVDEKAQPNLVGYGAAPRSAARPRRRARTGSTQLTIDRGDPVTRDAVPHDAIRPDRGRDDTVRERPRSTPPVRMHAKELGVDLALIEAGAAGVITRADVDAFAQRTAAGAAITPNERTTRIPIRGVRKHTAAAMVRSAFTAPHVTTFLTVDVTATTELIASLREDRRREGPRIGVMAVAAKAVCLALAQHPSVNSRWDADAGEIIQYDYVNLGIAAATERGLVVPNIADADAMNLGQLAAAIADVAETARAGRTAPSAMTGGTFSISNVGVFGVDAGTPILNPPEAGILALGAVRRTPWEYRGEIALRDVMTLSLSFDHRLVDGEQGASFLVAVGDVLREPGRAMLLR